MQEIIELLKDFGAVGYAVALILGLLYSLQKLGYIKKQNTDDKDNKKNDYSALYSNIITLTEKIGSLKNDITNGFFNLNIEFSKLDERVNKIEQQTAIQSGLTNEVVKTINDIQAQYHEIQQQYHDFKEPLSILANKIMNPNNRKHTHLTRNQSGDAVNIKMTHK